MMPRPRLTAFALIGAVILLFGLSLTVGKAQVPWRAWLDPAGDPRWQIIFALRLPRTLLGILVGGALGLSGAAMQGYARNPLADPGILGVSASAAFGAVLTLFFGLSRIAPWFLEVAAIAGAGLGGVMMVALAGRGTSATSFLLAGLVVNMLASAGVTLMLSLSPNPWSAEEIINWLMGSLADHSLTDAAIAAPLILAGSALLLTLGTALNALTLGETGAAGLGVSLSSVRLRLALGLGLASGAAVAAVGVVGFVGLMAPHMLRAFVGPKPSSLLWPSALGGAVVILAADILVRLTPAASELRLGVATAMVGGPFFFVLLIANRRQFA